MSKARRPKDLRAKYRPQKFRQLAQGLSDPVISTITKSLQQRVNLQAIMLRGPYGSGKTTIARILGQRACCRQQHLHDYEPCRRCDGCRAVEREPRSADWDGYSEYDTQSLSPRETIDRIMANIPFRKQGGKIMPQRVVTLDEFHRLAQIHQEKFVKIIEDYSQLYKTLFVLCVASDANICQAISQRCTHRRIANPPLARAVRHISIVARAEGRTLNKQEAELLVATADCTPRVYLGLLQDAMILSQSQIISQESVIAACNMLESTTVKVRTLRNSRSTIVLV